MLFPSKGFDFIKILAKKKKKWLMKKQHVKSWESAGEASKELQVGDGDFGSAAS